MSVLLLWLTLGCTVRYSLSPQEISRALPLGFPSGSGCISPYIPPLVIIQKQSRSFRCSRAYLQHIALYYGILLQSRELYTLSTIFLAKKVPSNSTGHLLQTPVGCSCLLFHLVGRFPLALGAVEEEAGDGLPGDEGVLVSHLGCQVCSVLFVVCSV